MDKEIFAKYNLYTNKVKLLELDYIFECNEVDIAKYFIKDVFGLNPHEIEFNCIRETVSSFFANRKIEFPENEKEFYITI